MLKATGESTPLFDILKEYVPESVARGILNYAIKRTRVDAKVLQGHKLPPHVVSALHRGAEMFIDNDKDRRACKSRIFGLINTGNGSDNGAEQDETNDTTIPINVEYDIVSARHQARQTAESMGFSKTDQVKIATSVSELARNIYKYTRGGTIEIKEFEDGAKKGIRIIASDKGPGIDNLEEIMSGGYKSKTGLGLGIKGCKMIMDDFDIKTSPETGTVITLRKVKWA